jgi:hypothetical protein
MIKIRSLDFDDAVALVPYSDEPSGRAAHRNGEPAGPVSIGGRAGGGAPSMDTWTDHATAIADLDMISGREALSVGVPYPVAKSDPFRLASVATLMPGNIHKRDA